jgi:hypothetical protein
MALDTTKLRDAWSAKSYGQFQRQAAATGEEAPFGMYGPKSEVLKCEAHPEIVAVVNAATPATTDADGDGVMADVDQDDNDATVGAA